MLQTKGYTAPAGFTPWRLETIYRTNLQSAYGFNCRCRVRSLTKEEAERIGISEGKIVWKTENITKTDPTPPKIQIGGYIDEKGNTYYTDKGFSYNPAKAFENWVDTQNLMDNFEKHLKKE